MSTTLTFSPVNTYAGYRQGSFSNMFSSGSGFATNSYTNGKSWTGMTNISEGVSTYHGIIRSYYFNNSTTSIPISLLAGKVSSGTLTYTKGSSSYNPYLHYGIKTAASTTSWTYTDQSSSSDPTVNSSGTYTRPINFPTTTYAIVLGPWSKVTYTTISNVTLTFVAPAYTITYNANNGSGAPSAQSVEITTTGWTTTLSTTKPTRSGYDFLGWSTSNTATSASYAAGGSITISDNTTLYAVWRLANTIRIVNSSADGLDLYRIYVVNNSNALEAYIPYVVNSAGTGLDRYS